MKRLVLFVLVASAVSAQTVPVLTTEVLVNTTATQLPALSERKAIEIQNLGPNAIYCALTSSSKAVVNKARKIDAGGTWALDLPASIPMYCVSSVLQVTGAATIVTEIR